jgi:hypothetical protein
MPVLIHGLLNLNDLNNILTSGKIYPLCHTENTSKGTFYTSREPCKKFDTQKELINYVLEKKSNYMLKNKSNDDDDDDDDNFQEGSDYFVYMSCIFDIKKANLKNWNMIFPYCIIIDPEILKDTMRKNEHIHMTVEWSYGNITENTILYDDKLTPLENLEIFHNLRNQKIKSRKETYHDTEIVSTEYDISKHILGIAYNEKLIKSIDKNEITKISEMKESLEKKYPNILWLNSLSEIKKII